jgi:hypothetical protein
VIEAQQALMLSNWLLYLGREENRNYISNPQVIIAILIDKRLSYA